MEQAARSERLPRIVMSVATPPPVSGQAIATRVLLDGLRELGLAPTVLPLNPPGEPGGAAGKVRWYARHVRELSSVLGRGGRGDRGALVYYLQVASSRLGSLRDVALLSVARARGVPALLHVHCSGFAENLRRLPAPLGTALRALLREACAVVVLDEAEGRRIEEAAPGTRTVVVPNGVESDVVAAATTVTPRPPSGGAEGPFRVAFVAHFFPFKGYATVLEAARLAARRGLPFRFAMAGALPGDLPGRPPTVAGVALDPERFVAEHRLDNVELLGVVRGEAKFELLAKSHAFCLPSHFEVQPISILEAMHFALPVVSSPVGGIPEMLGEGPQRELLVEPGDAEGLLQRLERLRTDADFYADVAARMQRRARERFTPRAHAEAMVELLREAAGGAA